MKGIILYPTDFSKCADNAFLHALTVAKVLDCKIQIVHSLDFEQNDMTTLSLIGKVKKEAELKIQGLKEKGVNEGVECDISLPNGKLSLWLSEYVSTEKPILVVMGTTGASNIKNKIFGSTTYSIIRNTNIPVLAIPEQVKIKAFSHFVLSSDYKEKDVDVVQFLSRLAKPSKTNIDVVHILNNEASKKVNTQKLLDNLKNRVELVEDYDNIKYHLLYSESRIERLKTLIKEEDTAILALVMEKQNALGRLFFGSLTDKMVHHVNIPLLVFPNE